MIFEPDAETMPRAELHALQDQRLGALAAYAYDRVPFYRRRFEELGLTPDAIRQVADLPRLPFTRKTDLRDQYPFGLFAVPVSEMSRIHCSSGTTGKPTVVGYTRDDVDLFARVCARSLAMAGAKPGMILHNAYGYGLFTGGLGLHYGGERLGMVVVPVSGGMTERQVMMILDFRPTVICCTPSYALTLAQEFQRQGVSPEEISVRYAIVGAEPWTETMRVEIDQRLGVRCTNIYGLSEIIGPGVSCECVDVRQGSHVNEDHFLPEIVDAKTGDVLPEGSEGVLVLTTLTKQGLPLIRYWTGDITSLSSEPCACGRTLTRMALIKGRSDDMLIVRGVNVYPTQIETALGTVAELAPHYRLILTRQRTLDELEVQVEVSEEFFCSVSAEVLSEEVVDTDQHLRELRARAGAAIRGTVGIGATVRLMAPRTVPRSEGGKLQRVVDQRHLG
ncbi:MAG TPA: phenylacetate--CoA ligase [Candidatus Dormibacteraeota bacterium]|nr:phenylacetate--CoA ligase [Candidatus Dormibacteraeota bacterium]